MAKAIRATQREILAANEGDLTEARAAGVSGSFLDRLTLDRARIEAMAKGLEVVAKLKDPVGIVLEKWKRPNGMTIERVRTPIGVIGVIYESRPECHRRCRRALPQGRQCRDPARRIGFASLLARHSRRDDRRASHRAAAGRCDPARAGARPRRGRRNAVGSERQYRRDRAARRQEPGGARAGGSARAGLRASRRHLPCLYRQEGQARDGEVDCDECQDAPHRRLRRGRDAC